VIFVLGGISVCRDFRDCGVCAIAAFSDDYMNDLLLLDGVERFVIYILMLKGSFIYNDFKSYCERG